jgi:2-polyprenyl-6-methoxyphenol hydroxylase-like FAD-dependent oxidoreductase
MLKWPGFLERLMKNALPPSLEFYKYDGTRIVKLSDKDAGGEGIISAPLWRNTLHTELYMYAQELGIPIEFNRSAAEFSESETKGLVQTEDGRNYEADVVIAADGISSRSAKLIVSELEPPTSSEYAIYRTSFPLDHALKDPDVAAFWGPEKFQGVRIFLADDLHIVTAKSSKTNRVRPSLCISRRCN